MPHFEPNDLQKALFIEVMDRTFSDSGDYLARQQGVVRAWLDQIKPILGQLAQLGRAGVRNGRSDHPTMLLDFTVATSSLPHDVLRWLDEWDCLRNLVSIDSLADLSEEECRRRFQTLATLDAEL